MKSLDDTSQEFLLHCQYEKKLDPKTLKAYDIDLRQFSDFIGLKRKPLSILEIDKTTLIEYHRNMHKIYAVKTIKRKIACIKALFTYYEFENDGFINPFRRIRITLKEPFKVPVVMNFREVSLIFENLYALRNKEFDRSSYSYKSLVRDIAVLELFFASGIRVSELSNLKARYICLDEGVFKVNGKGGKDRVIQLCNLNVIQSLKTYQSLFIAEIDSAGFFFINRLGNRLSEQSARNIVKKYAAISNIQKPVTPHTYRHTFATMLLEEGVDIKYIQKLLGHSSILTTQIYTHVSSAKQREILNTKHPRNRMTTFS